MSTLLIKCRCCGAEIQFVTGEKTRRCVHCQAVNPRPQANTPEVPNIMNLAVEQRLQCEFYHAEQSYRRALEIEKDNYQARWGLVLCKYGVEYVRDRSGRYLPVCHTIRVRPMQEDMDYQSAYELAPEEIRAGYKRDAAYIDSAQQRIRALRREDAGYDIFLCYKETTLEDVNQQTAESRDARRLYNDLSRVGYRVFYAPETLQEEAGENYEAGIYHAIETAKVMLVIGRKREHLLSGWVQSEWSRFLEHMEKDQSEHLLPSKHLLPLYAEMRERELPEPFAHWGLQALSMEKPEWRLNLESSLIKLVPQQAGGPMIPAEPMMQEGSLEKQRAEVIVTKGFALLEKGNFDQAQIEFERALTLYPRFSKAYWGMALSQFGLKSGKELGECHVFRGFVDIAEVESSVYWQKALEYASLDEKEEYDTCIQAYHQYQAKYAEEEQKKRKIEYEKARQLENTEQQLKSSVQHLLSYAKARREIITLEEEVKRLQAYIDLCRICQAEQRSQLAKYMPMLKVFFLIFNRQRKMALDRIKSKARSISVDMDFKIAGLESDISNLQNELHKLEATIHTHQQRLSAEECVGLSLCGCRFIFGRNHELGLLNDDYRELEEPDFTLFQWIAVASQGSHILLFQDTCYITSAFSYDGNPKWTNSLLRGLAIRFFDEYLSKDEQQALAESEQLSPCKERIFCLNHAEAKYYFTGSKSSYLLAHKGYSALTKKSLKVDSAWCKWWLREGMYSSQCGCYDSLENVCNPNIAEPYFLSFDPIVGEENDVRFACWLDTDKYDLLSCLVAPDDDKSD